jgi:hypothetical protein
MREVSLLRQNIDCKEENMGLDMYLDKTLYISEFDKQGIEKIDTIYNVLGIQDLSNNYKHLELRLPAIYWRKSNQIHGWFVEHIQEGDDNCQTYHVDIEQLEELLELVKTQLKNKKKILLNPSEGFFFGSTDIDEYYWADLENTRDKLEKEIGFYREQSLLGRHWHYEYRSSW